MYRPEIGDRIEDIDTPAMIVDMDVMEANIETLMTSLLPTGVRVRPHLKTTKSADLARIFIEQGATGGCCAKLSEAEVMLAEGITDILITTEIIGKVKVRRLINLFRHYSDIKIVIDSAEGASAIDAAIEHAQIHRKMQVLMDINVGANRTGVSPGSPVAVLGEHLRKLSHLDLIGVQGYEGHLQHLHSRTERERKCRYAMGVLNAMATVLRCQNFDIQVVTAGGTGTAEFCAAVPGVTEVQPGSFVFMDADYSDAIGSMYQQSLTILTTVISLRDSDVAIVDAGLKSLTNDSGPARPLEGNGPSYRPQGDEHGIVTWPKNEGQLYIGKKLHLIPSHIDPTVNLHDIYYACRNGKLEAIWPVSTRGKVQ